MSTTRWPCDPIVMDLIRIRYEQKLPVHAVAARIGVGQSQLTGWETGYRRPQVNNLTAWARALGYELALRPADARGGA